MSRKTQIVLFSVLAAFGLCLALWVQLRDDALNKLDLQPEKIERPSVGARRQQQDEAQPSSGESARSEKPATSPAEAIPTQRFLVLGDDDSPAGNALVQWEWVEPGGRRWNLEKSLWSMQLASRARSRGATTSLTGEFEFPIARGNLRLRVESEDACQFFVEEYWQQDLDRNLTVLRLTSREFVRVTVLNEDDQPLSGIPIGLFSFRKSRWHALPHRLLSRAFSNSDGVALIPCPSLRNEQGEWRTWDLEVSFAFPCTDPVRLPFDPSLPNRNLGSLKMPPSRQLALDLAESDRRLMPGLRPPRFKVWANFDEKTPFVYPYCTVGTTEFADISARASFGWVGIGLEFTVTTPPSKAPMSHSAPQRIVHEVFQGPKIAKLDKIHVHQLKAFRSKRKILGKILDWNGQPIPGAKIRYGFEGTLQSAIEDYSSVTLDSRSFLHLPLDPTINNYLSHEQLLADTGGQKTSALLDIKLAEEHLLPGYEGYQATIKIDLDTVGPAIDIGECQLKKPTIWATGRVTDSQGKAIIGARIGIAEAFDDGWDILCLEAPHAFSNQDGDYECRKADKHQREFPTKESQLAQSVMWAWAPGFAVQKQPFRFAESGPVDFILSPAIEYEWAFLFDSKIDKSLINVNVSGPAAANIVEEGGQVRAGFDSAPQPRYRYQQKRLQPGSLTLKVTLKAPYKGRELVLFERTSTIIKSGRETIDLKETLELFEISATDESGDPIRARIQFARYDYKHLPLTIPGDFLNNACSIFASGFQSQHYPDGIPTQAISLQAAPRVLVRIRSKGNKRPPRDLDGLEAWIYEEDNDRIYIERPKIKNNCFTIAVVERQRLRISIYNSGGQILETIASGPKVVLDPNNLPAEITLEFEFK